MTRERMIDTPTTQALKAKRKSRTEDSPYIFRLDEEQVAALRRRGLPDSAMLGLAAITAAAFGGRHGEWVALTPRVLDAFARSYRWWARATSALEAAGLIECQRHPGRMPRYRLVSGNRLRIVRHG